uniref:Uncharacterized protein n=1 Tax=Romanomermis culicivorax TaxID=13658 RepID=A0A915KZ09_ROMCU
MSNVGLSEPATLVAVGGSRKSRFHGEREQKGKQEKRRGEKERKKGRVKERQERQSASQSTNKPI